MSFSIVKIANSIPDIKDKSYLEIGVWDSKNHAQILSQDKTSVDIDKPATFTMPSDDFFAQNKRRYDIAFIDADHRLDQAVRDYNNAVEVCDELILMHDMFPDHEMQATEDGTFAGDVYKLLYHWLKRGDSNVRVLNGDCGMTAVFPPFKKVDIAEIDRSIRYPDLQKLPLHRYSIKGMQGIMKSWFTPRTWYVDYIAKMLPVMADLLEEAGINYWLDWGTLLGAVRIGRMIPWDFDIDLGAFETDVDRIASLRDKAESLGCTLQYYPEYHKFRLYGDKGPDFHIDIDLWGIKHDIAVARFDERNIHWVNELVNHGAIEFEGRGYPCPANPVNSIQRLIGSDWETAKMSDGNLIFLKQYAPELLPRVKGISTYASAWDTRK